MNIDIELPSEWQWAKFGDITKERLIGLVRGSKEQHTTKAYSYIKMDAITIGGKLDLALATKVDASTQELKRYTLREGDFLFNTRNSQELVGKTAVFDSKEKDWLYNNNIMRVRFIENVDPYYVNLAFQTSLIKRQIEAVKRRTTSVCAIYDYQLVNVEVPLPPLQKQKRIAAILGKADAIRRKRREAIALTEELLRSTFLDMFGDPVTNPQGWDKCKLSKLGCVVTGNTPPRANLENYGDDIEWIKSDNITTPYHFLTYATEGLSSQGKKIARIVPPNSILVACIAGSRSSIGRAALADREVAFNQQINAIVPNPNVDPYFLYTQFFVAQHLVQAQSTDSMKGLVSKSKFSNIEFMRPPEQKQREFGKWFLKFHTWSGSLRDGEQSTDNLFNSLLQKAFRGEL